MAVSFKVISKSIFQFIWKQFQKMLSFLTTLFIFSALVVMTLYLMNIKPYVVVTGSMEPAIPVRSICFVDENISLQNIEVGDVISFKIGNDTLVTHRVIEVCDGKYTTKGDANNTEDAITVTQNNYIGKTVVVIPKVGVILIYLQSRKGKILAFTLIILLLIFSFIPKKEEKEQ